MHRRRSLFLIMGSIVIASLLIACSSPAEPAASTAAPTTELEPPAAASSEDEVLGPTDKSGVPRITAEELKNRLDNGEEILIFDTRGTTAYNSRHIAGAEKAPGDFDDFPKGKEIVLYCA